MATQMPAKVAIDQLNSFLRGEISAVETYGKAHDRAKTDAVRLELTECMRSHERRVQLLRERIIQLGGVPAEKSGPWGTLAKVIEAGATALGEKAAIAALEEGEDHGLKDYRADLSKLDPVSRLLVENEILPAQVKTHRSLSSLKMTLHH